MTTTQLTKIETARLLRAVQQISRRAGDEFTYSGAIKMIIALTGLLDGVRFDLMNEHDERLREATPMETIESVMSRHGWITVDNVVCYVDCYVDC